MKELKSYKRTGSIVMAVICENGINRAVTLNTARSDEEVKAELLAGNETEEQPAKIGFDAGDEQDSGTARNEEQDSGKQPEDPEAELEELRKIAAELKVPGYALYKDPAKLREAIAAAEGMK